MKTPKYLLWEWKEHAQGMLALGRPYTLDEMASWWLSQIEAHDREIVEMIESMKQHPQGVLGDSDYLMDISYNAALEDIKSKLQNK